jgi:hypothetical protein
MFFLYCFLTGYGRGKEREGKGKGKGKGREGEEEEVRRGGKKRRGRGKRICNNSLTIGSGLSQQETQQQFLHKSLRCCPLKYGPTPSKE